LQGATWKLHTCYDLVNGYNSGIFEAALERVAADPSGTHTRRCSFRLAEP